MKKFKNLPDRGSAGDPAAKDTRSRPEILSECRPRWKKWEDGGWKKKLNNNIRKKGTFCHTEKTKRKL